MITIIDELKRIDAEAEPLQGRGAIILDNAKGRYLSGVPYLWSGFAERAFVFRGEDQAHALIQKFALNAEVRVRY